MSIGSSVIIGSGTIIVVLQGGRGRYGEGLH